MLYLTFIAASAVQVGTCEQLQSQWREVEMNLAEIYAEGLGDNSAPRATMRATRTTSEMSQANVILGLMAANKCPAPTKAPSEYTYAAAALNCSTARLKGATQIPACDRTLWKPEIPKR